MQTATTLQFRKAVRKVAKKQGLDIYDSYTNGSSVSGRRTVGFSITGATDALARKIEKKLNKKGLSALTRHTNSGRHAPSGCFSFNGHDYIRGTCILA